jgi:SPP1 gp7 family putative phage head morphogenesis protein
MPTTKRPKADTLPAWRTDDAAILRTLKTDVDTLYYTEWWVRRRLWGLDDQESRWLADRYRESYQAMSAAINDAYDDNGKPRLDRRLVLLDQIEREFNRLTNDAAAHLLDTETKAYLQGYYGRGWALDQTAGHGVTRVPLLPTDAVRASILTPYMGRPWGELLAMAHEEFVYKVKRSIANSLISGEGVQQAQRRLRDELGITTDRRKGAKDSAERKANRGNFYRTRLIARTEIMRASNLGALSIYEANSDILAGWEWTSARDHRTCPLCGGLDGRVFKFDDPMLAPPSGSHPGCRCTALPVLKDKALSDAVTGGPRETYAEWAAKRGITFDGSLADQRVAKMPFDIEQARAAAANRDSLAIARRVTPTSLDNGTSRGPMADYMSSFFAYDSEANAYFDRGLAESAKNDLFYNLYTLGRGYVWQNVMEDARLQAAGLLAVDDQLGGGVLTRKERNMLLKLASPDDNTALNQIDGIRDRRMRGALGSGKLSMKQSYDKFISAAEADGAERLRDARLPQWQAGR